MKIFSPKQWNKNVLSYFWNVWKNIVLLLENVGAATDGSEQLQLYSKILVKSHDAINLVLCYKCPSQSHWTMQSIAREERLHCSSDVCVIQDDLCVKREKETTVCYKLLPRKQPKLIPLLSNLTHYMHKQRRLFDDCLYPKLLILSDIC